MKKLIFYFTFLVVAGMIACNDASNDHKAYGKDREPKTQADSLAKSVDDDHNIGMAKMFRLTTAEQTAGRLLDSIAKLPVKARQASKPFKNKLDSLQKELSYAETAMNKWMNEYKMDSLVNNVEERVKYLSSEKLKVGKIKEAILNSLQKADSVIKDKF